MATTLPAFASEEELSRARTAYDTVPVSLRRLSSLSPANMHPVGLHSNRVYRPELCLTFQALLCAKFETNILTKYAKIKNNLQNCQKASQLYKVTLMK